MSDGGSVGAATSGRQRVQNESAFVLHTHPWKETSLVLDLFTRSQGRIAAVAKGARRPHSQLRALLLPFQPVLVSWTGRSELRVIQAVEWRGGIPQLGGVALMCGFYLNELLRAALAREDAHEALFDAYANAVGRLAVSMSHSTVLRVFERALLSELGYALQFDAEVDTGQALIAEARYRYLPEKGPQLLGADQDAEAFAVRGKTLIDMGRDDYSDPITAAEGKRLMRSLLGTYLGHAELHTRQLLKDLQQL
jgi:DNA repair protein RecO (recombination protein O)